MFRLFGFLALIASAALVHAATVNITAGAGGLAFNPSNVTAAVGDTIVFYFINQHTVTQSSFGSPCSKLNGGFDSGPMLGPQSNYTVEVKSTDPIWIFCSIPTHCENGMVAAINAPATGDLTFSNFQKLAEGKSITTTGTLLTSTPSSTGASSTGSSTATTSGGAAQRVMLTSPFVVTSLAMAVLGASVGALVV